ncbi:hypothetical protein ACJX0J_037955, partial [Zea mays]
DLLIDFVLWLHHVSWEASINNSFFVFWAILDPKTYQNDLFLRYIYLGRNQTSSLRFPSRTRAANYYKVGGGGGLEDRAHKGQHAWHLDSHVFKYFTEFFRTKWHAKILASLRKLRVIRHHDHNLFTTKYYMTTRSNLKTNFR